MDPFVRTGERYLSINKIESIYISKEGEVIIHMVSGFRHCFVPPDGEDPMKTMERMYSKVCKAQHSFITTIQNQSIEK